MEYVVLLGEKPCSYKIIGKETTKSEETLKGTAQKLGKLNAKSTTKGSTAVQLSLLTSHNNKAHFLHSQPHWPTSLKTKFVCFVLFYMHTCMHMLITVYI